MVQYMIFPPSTYNTIPRKPISTFLGSHCECFSVSSTHKQADVSTAEFQTAFILFLWPFNPHVSLIIAKVC